MKVINSENLVTTTSLLLLLKVNIYLFPLLQNLIAYCLFLAKSNITKYIIYNLKKSVIANYCSRYQKSKRLFSFVLVIQFSYLDGIRQVCSYILWASVNRAWKIFQLIIHIQAKSTQPLSYEEVDLESYL